MRLAYRYRILAAAWRTRSISCSCRSVLFKGKHSWFKGTENSKISVKTFHLHQSSCFRFCSKIAPCSRKCRHLICYSFWKSIMQSKIHQRMHMCFPRLWSWRSFLGSRKLAKIKLRENRLKPEKRSWAGYCHGSLPFSTGTVKRRFQIHAINKLYLSWKKLQKLNKNLNLCDG